MLYHIHEQHMEQASAQWAREAAEMEAQRGTSTARTKRGDGEIARFKEALKRLGPSDNGKLAEAVGTRDISQVTAFKSRFLKAYPTWLTDNYHPEQPATTASSSRCSSRVPPVPRPPGQGLPTKGVRELGVPHPPLHRQQPPPPPPPRGYVIRHHSPYGQGHRKGALWGRGRPANADPVAYASHTPSHSGRGDPITTPCATLRGNNPEAPARPREEEGIPPLPPTTTQQEEEPQPREEALAIRGMENIQMWDPEEEELLSPSLLAGIATHHPLTRHRFTSTSSSTHPTTPGYSLCERQHGRSGVRVSYQSHQEATTATTITPPTMVSARQHCGSGGEVVQQPQDPWKRRHYHPSATHQRSAIHPAHALDIDKDPADRPGATTQGKGDWPRHLPTSHATIFTSTHPPTGHSLSERQHRSPGMGATDNQPPPASPSMEESIHPTPPPSPGLLPPSARVPGPLGRISIDPENMDETLRQPFYRELTPFTGRRLGNFEWVAFEEVLLRWSTAIKDVVESSPPSQGEGWGTLSGWRLRRCYYAGPLPSRMWGQPSVAALPTPPPNGHSERGDRNGTIHPKPEATPLYRQQTHHLTLPSLQRHRVHTQPTTGPRATLDGWPGQSAYRSYTGLTLAPA
ncbi:hypothetical protein EMCRGX_G005922 [Ephydatia muelleri]